MRPIDWSIVQDSDPLVLLTAEEVTAGAEPSIADFRDSFALYYSVLGGWLGLCRAGVMIGTGSPQLVNGIWYVKPDFQKIRENRDHEPTVSEIALRRIL